MGSAPVRTGDAAVPLSVLHLDGGRRWGGGQNQVRLLMGRLRERGIPQLCLCPRGAPLAERLAAEGLPVRTIAWWGGSDPRAMVAVFRTAAHYALLHCHDAHAVQVSLIPARLRGAPLVASRRVARPTRAWKWNRADRIVAISDVVRQSLLEDGVRPERIRMVSSGVDPAELAALPPLDPPLRERLGIPPTAYVIGNIGRLEPAKNQRVLVEAAARGSDEHWVIMGEGPERRALEERIARRGVDGRVHLAGFVPDARAALRELDTFVFSSTGDALGTSLLDAMATGLPCLAAATGGPGEIMTPVHARSGVGLFAADEADQLADAVSMLRDAPDLVERHVAAQAARLESYRLERTVASTVSIYEELADGASGS